MTNAHAIKDFAQILHSRIGEAPDTALIAGSGLASFVGALEPEAEIPLRDLPGFPIPAVAGHIAALTVAKAGARRIAVLLGRAHLYEGGPAADCVVSVRALAAWGCRTLILTNAAGGLNANYRPGDLMLIADHLDMTLRSPLRGAHDAAMGPRFPDLSDCYSPALRERLLEAARIEGIPMREGVYAANLGPAYETRAEASMLRRMGADAVGMSTAPEAIAARQCGLQVAGLSYIANSLVGAKVKVTHEEVLANSRLAMANLQRLMLRFLET